MYRVILHRDADKDYRGFDARLKARTDRALNDIRLSPYHGPNIKKLKGKLSNLYRYRISGFRILSEAPCLSCVVKYQKRSGGVEQC